MASINKLSEELNFKDDKNDKNNNNGHESFLKSLVMNESYHKIGGS